MWSCKRLATASMVAVSLACVAAAIQLRFDNSQGPPIETQLGDLWSYAPMTDRNLEANQSTRWLLPSNLSEMATIGWNWTDYATTNIIVKRMTTVRILGGWGPKSTEPGEPGWPDLVWREGGPDGRGALQYRWDAFFNRLDPMVNAGIAPTVVLDNVPFALAGANASLGEYGQTMGPRNNLQDYHTVIQELTKQIVQRYGQERVLAEFRFRVATEPNTVPGHWSDTVEEWNAMYDAATAAVTSVLPSAFIGPANFCPFALTTGCVGSSSTVVNPIVDHIAEGVNVWTNVSGATPISFLSSSFYGGWDGRSGVVHEYGYDPAKAGMEAMGLRKLRERHPSRLASLPLYFHEYGMLGSPTPGIQYRASEGGSFGGAWRLASSAAAAAMGVSQIFRWGPTDWLDKGTERALIIHSNVYLAALGNAVSEVEVAANVKSTASVLFTSNTSVPCGSGGQAPTCASGSAESCCVLPRILANPQDPPPPPSAYAGPTQIIVSGMGVTIPAAAGSASPLCGPQIAPPGAGVQPLCTGDSMLLVSVFSTGSNTSRPVDTTITMPASQVLGEAASVAAHAVYVLNRTRAPLDIMYSTAAHHPGWLAVNDSAIRSLHAMLTPAGLAGISDDLEEYRQAQITSFTPIPDPAELVSMQCDADTCTMQLAAVSPPTVLAVVLRAPASAEK